MINLFLIKKKKKLYYPFTIDQKAKLSNHLRNEFRDWNVISYSTEKNQFYPKTKFQVLLYLLFSLNPKNALYAIYKPADTLFFVKYFQFQIKEAKKYNYVKISVNFQVLAIFVIALLLTSLLLFVISNDNNNFKEILGLVYGLSIVSIIYSIFYIKLSIKVIIKFLDKSINNFNKKP